MRSKAVQLGVQLIVLFFIFLVQAFGEWIELPGGGKAHPTRILVKWKDPRTPQLYSTLAELALKGLEPEKVLPSNPAIWILRCNATIAPMSEDGAYQAKRLIELINKLRSSGLFEIVQPDWVYTLAATEPLDSAYQSGQLWALKNVGQQGGVAGADIISDPDGGAENAWDITTGSTNVVVAVLDTGIRYTHIDLRRQMWINPGEIPNNGKDDDGNGYVDDVYGINAIVGSGDPWDDHGHGTHLAGIIGASANDSGAHVGVAWKVSLMGIKVLDASGVGFTSDLIEGIYYAVNKGAKILNVSLVTYSLDELLYDTVAFASKNDVLVVCAAGNERNNNDLTPAYPASFDTENVISVTSINRYDKLSEFANFGPITVHLAAPGEEIFSCWIGGDSDYRIQSGTSASAGFVSGTAALIWSAFPKASMAEVRERILRSTVPVSDLKGKTLTGGRLNAYKALKATPDGILEVTVDPRNGATVLISTNLPVYVKVYDLFDITNATVRGTIIADSKQIEFKNDGKDPDAVAGDNIYSGYIDLTPYVIPPFSNVVEFLLEVRAPGKQTYSNIVKYTIVGPPPNDNFSSASKIPSIGAYGASIIISSNTYATIEFDEPIHAGVSTRSHSVWWKWSPATSGPVIVDTSGTSFDAVVAVYIGTRLTNLQLIAAADDIDGKRQPYVIFNAIAGQTYWIVIAGKEEGQVGQIRLRVEPNGGPDIYIPQVVINNPKNGENFTSRSIRVEGIAYDPLPNASGIKQVSVSVNGALAQIASGQENWSINVNLREGINTIQAFVEDWAGNRGSSERIVVYYTPVKVPNDLFGSVLSPSSEFYLREASGVRNGSNEGATKEYGEPDHAGNKGGASVWFSWEAPADGIVQFDTTGSLFDTLLAAYIGERVDQLKLVAANDDVAEGERVSRITFGVKGGTTYRIAIDGFNGETGKYRLIWQFKETEVVELYIIESEFGTTDPAPGYYLIQKDKEVVIRAIPNAGYTFIGWESSVGLPPENPLKLKLGSSISVRPVFAYIPPTANFETGTLPSGWVSWGDSPWLVTTEAAAEGTYSVRSGRIGDGQQSILRFSGEFRDGEASFMYMVSSEAGWDFLEFYVDGVLQVKWSGEIPWTEYRFQIGAGIHTLEWRYVKDSSGSSGLDASFIDVIRLPLVVVPTPDQQPIITLRPTLMGAIEIVVKGVTPGVRYTLLVANDILGPWYPLSETIATVTELRFIDYSVVDVRRRFYKVMGQR